jgi:hypothetical protein
MALIDSREADWPSGYKPPHNKGKGNPNRRVHRERLQTQPFIAWDGEGYSTDDGEHHYMLWGNSNGEYVKGESLSWRQCFPLLLESHGKGINVIFGGDYDVIMMTKGMPFVVRKRLLGGLPVKYGGYRIVWFRRKYLMLKETHGKRRSAILYDVHSFFQCSFVNACKQYLGDDETLQEMHRMKLKRDGFTLDDDSVIPYWQSELEYLIKLMDKLRELLAEVGIKPRGWYGPGAVASALLNLHSMSFYYQRELPADIVDIGERAYYGGRFEQFKVGKLERVYEYDIRSAYPKAITMLPDFSSTSWTYYDGNVPQRINPYGLYCVSWDIPFTPFAIGPLPWRSANGRIFFPLCGHRSWYWGIEIEKTLVENFPPNQYTIHEAWLPAFANTLPCFSWVQAMYDDRARMKAEGNPAQMALKLGLNSLYGKLAQSTGARLKDDVWEKPKWHHILWGGWITAYTRARIYGVVSHQLASVVAIETDAVFVTKPIQGISVSEKLGEWEQVDIERILYVNSGVYYALNNGVWRLKSRGTEADRSKSADHWLEIFSRLPTESIDITLTMRRFGTDIRQPGRYARWFDYQTTTNMPHTFSKRVHKPEGCPTCLAKPGISYADWFHYLMVPQPLIESDWQESTPYKFPWREDTGYDWPDVIKSEIIEAPEELGWQ